MNRLTRLIVVLVALAVPGCRGGSVVEPSPLPLISCPAPPFVQSMDGTPVSVAYPAPTVTGGTEPVTVSCAPKSGSPFALGTNSVVCTAQDAEQRIASCSFAVSVTRPPQIGATKFLAFGDSITAGTLGDTCNGGPRFCASVSSVQPLTPEFMLRDLELLMESLNIPTSYPTVLQGLLRDLYVAQSPVVTNHGFGGEQVTNPATLARLVAELNEHAPQVLLLQEGINDLNTGGLEAIPGIAGALRTMIRTAQNRGVQHVLLGTLLPQRPCSCRAFSLPYVTAANDAIRAMAVSEGVPLVDLYQAFAGQEGTLLSLDGLHPNVAGYEKIASTFLETIRARLETSASPTASHVPR